MRTTSIDQYGATLAAWLGVPIAPLQAVFPKHRERQGTDRRLHGSVSV